MATQTRLSLEEYLQTSYRPDCEYIDGEIQERNVGKWEHARTQFWLAGWFSKHEEAWGVMGSTEQRMRVTRTRVRIPDVVLVHSEEQPDILVRPPVLIVEILSPEDTYKAMQDRISDYRAMGVRSIWIIDPKTRSGRMCSGDLWTTAQILRVPETEIYVDLDVLFRALGPNRA